MCICRHIGEMYRQLEESAESGTSSAQNECYGRGNNLFGSAVPQLLVVVRSISKRLDEFDLQKYHVLCFNCLLCFCSF